MNIQRFALIILFSNVSCIFIGMELDLNKVKADRHQMVSAWDTIKQHYGDHTFSLKTSQERSLFLNKFLGTWAAESFSGCLKYSFDSYMVRTQINTNWIETLHQQKIIKGTITVTEFLSLVIDRFDTNLAKYN